MSGPTESFLPMAVVAQNHPALLDCLFQGNSVARPVRVDTPVTVMVVIVEAGRPFGVVTPPVPFDVFHLQVIGVPCPVSGPGPVDLDLLENGQVDNVVELDLGVDEPMLRVVREQFDDSLAVDVGHNANGLSKRPQPIGRTTPRAMRLLNQPASKGPKSQNTPHQNRQGDDVGA